MFTSLREKLKKFLKYSFLSDRAFILKDLEGDSGLRIQAEGALK